MTGVETANDEHARAAHEARRRRGPRRLLVGGTAAASVGTVTSGLLGADGATGLFVLLLLLAVVLAAAGVWLGGGLLLDEFRGQPTSRGRGLFAAGLFVLALLCMTAVGGLVDTIGATS